MTIRLAIKIKGQAWTELIDPKPNEDSSGFFFIIFLRCFNLHKIFQKNGTLNENKLKLNKIKYTCFLSCGHKCSHIKQKTSAETKLFTSEYLVLSEICL